MGVVLALPYLFDGVEALFAADAAAQVPPVEPVPQAFGWREPARRTGTLRIIWVPGDDASGAMGDLGPARQPGREPRPLATLHEIFTVYIEARDASAAENERAQYQAARELYDAWYRAVHRVAHGTFVVRSQGWVIDKALRRAGAAIRVLCTVQAMVPDAPLSLVNVEGADIQTSELDVTETTTTEEP